MNNDGLSGLAGPQGAAVAAFLQILGESVGMRVDFNVLAFFTDGAFHPFSPFYLSLLSGFYSQLWFHYTRPRSQMQGNNLKKPKKNNWL
jgi:hypothetical protein